MNTVISFSCPAYLAMRLNDEKIGARKKSEWIADAIRKKLDGDFDMDIRNLETILVLANLYRRDDIDDHLKEEIKRRLDQ